MRRTRLLINVLLLLHALSASASGPGKEAPENGTWEGAIGDSKVMACFVRADDPAQKNQAVYFYFRYSKPIFLVPDPTNKTLWFEGDIQNPTGIWTVKVQGDRITGSWANSARTKTLPIALNRFKSISSDNAIYCGQDMGVFDPVVYPQILLEKVRSGDEKTVSGRRYRVLSALDGAVRSVELVDEGEVIHALNVLLANELKVSMSAYYTCPTNGERYSGRSENRVKPGYDASIEPLFWNEMWVSFVARSAGDCGGAHPFYDYSYSTWNLSTARRTNLWEWIRNSKKANGLPQNDQFYFNYAAPERLNGIITKRAIKQRLAFNPKEATEKYNCLDVIQNNSQYQIRLSTTGFIFTQAFAHVVKACTDDVEVTHAELMPFLTKKGKEAVKGIQERGP